jgi:GEVED domain
MRSTGIRTYAIVTLAIFLLLVGLVLANVSSAFALAEPVQGGQAHDADPGSKSSAVEREATPSQYRPMDAGLLEEHFGVQLSLREPWGGGTNYSFDFNSFAPTKHTDTVDWVESDWYGNWSTADFSHTDIRGNYPSGSEWYDVEALYFDNDADNIYIVMVTSVPHYHDWGGGHVGTGIYESRVGGLWVRPGDLSINLFLGQPRQERNDTTWHYNYGVDITHENRDLYQEVGPYRSVQVRDDELGNKLYRTAYDAGGDVKNPSNSDWYVGAPVGATQAYWEHTSFDPQSSESLSLGKLQYLGDTTVRYYEYTFPDGKLENGAGTYIYEVTIPRALFGADNPRSGQAVGLQWVEGCRNDGEENLPVVNLIGYIDNIDTGDAPDSTNHKGVPMSNMLGGAPGSANYPTVADSSFWAGGGPAGMCHAISSSGLVLGTTVSYESDADRSPDADGATNFDPLAGVADRDSDDGVSFPPQWTDGITATVTYIVSAPPTAASGDRYVNVWFDWNRDGDWADDSVVCAHGTRDEHALINRVVNVPNDVKPGQSATFALPINPCNPGSQDLTWVRITLSDEPISNVNDDGRGPGYCFAEGETEDYLYDPATPTAVDLASFEATAQGNAIQVTWETASEVDNLGFNLYRAETLAGPYVLLNGSLIPSEVPSSPMGAVYQFVDRSIRPGVTNYYWLEAVDAYGLTTRHGPVHAQLPRSIKLRPARPRPAPRVGSEN